VRLREIRVIVLSKAYMARNSLPCKEELKLAHSVS
jgi:hypothetical protein